MADQAPEPVPEVAAELDKQSSDGKPMIDVKVYAPFHVYYEGPAYSLSAVNGVGPFDILPGHRNFLCVLVPSSLVINTPDKGEKKIKISRALMYVKADHVSVFVDV